MFQLQVYNSMKHRKLFIYPEFVQLKGEGLSDFYQCIVHALLILISGNL